MNHIFRPGVTQNFEVARIQASSALIPGQDYRCSGNFSFSTFHNSSILMVAYEPTYVKFDIMQDVIGSDPIILQGVYGGGGLVHVGVGWTFQTGLQYYIANAEHIGHPIPPKIEFVVVFSSMYAWS